MENLHQVKLKKVHTNATSMIVKEAEDVQMLIFLG